MKKVKLFLDVFLFAILICSCGNSNSNVNSDDNTKSNRFLITDDNWNLGYIDNTGAVVIEPAYESASEFNCGLACVKLRNNNNGESNTNKRFGYIDIEGNIVIKPIFNFAGEFSEGLACVRVGADKDSKYGFIDKTGKFVIKPKFDKASKFSEGLACVVVNNKYGYIDKTGEFVIKPRFKFKDEYGLGEGFYDFSDGCAIVDVKGSYGYIDKKGVFIIPPQFDAAWGFSEGLARVSFGFGEKYKIVVIDKTGKIVFDDSDFIIKTFKFSEGLMGVYDKKNESYGYIDKTGKLIIRVDFEKIYEFNNKYNKDKSYNINMVDKYLGDFSEGLAVAGVGEFGDGLYGYIDKTGNFVIKPQFDYAYDFHEGIANVTVTKFDGEFNKNKNGYIDKSGKWIYVVHED